MIPYYKNGVDQPRCCEAAPGTTILGIVALLTAITTRPTIRTTTLGSELSVFLPALFSARIGEWEFIERAEEESRSAPAMGKAHPKIKPSRMVW